MEQNEFTEDHDPPTSIDQISESTREEFLTQFIDDNLLDETELEEYENLVFLNNLTPLLIILALLILLAISRYQPSLTVTLVLFGIIALIGIFIFIVQREMDHDKYTKSEKLRHYLASSIRYYRNDDYEKASDALIQGRSDIRHTNEFHPRHHKVLLHYANRLNYLDDPETAVKDTFEQIVPVVILREAVSELQTPQYYAAMPDTSEASPPARGRVWILHDAFQEHVWTVTKIRAYVGAAIAVVLISIWTYSVHGFEIASIVAVLAGGITWQVLDSVLKWLGIEK